MLDVKVGATVTRFLGGVEIMDLVVTAITDTAILCGPYRFSRKNGLEIDPDMGANGWDEHASGGRITKKSKHMAAIFDTQWTNEIIATVLDRHSAATADTKLLAESVMVAGGMIAEALDRLASSHDQLGTNVLRAGRG